MTRRPSLKRDCSVAVSHRAVVFVASLACVALAGGCASQKEYDLSPSARYDDEDGFDHAGDRAPSARTLYALARVLASQGKETQSQFVLVRAIQENPHFMPAYNELAEIYMRNGRLDDAMSTLSAGLTLSPRDPVLLNNLGMCHMMKGEHLKALEKFTQASAGMPEDARYRTNMAVASGMLGRYQDSLALYSQVLPAADAHYNLAVICDALKDSERAAIEYEQAEELRTRS